MTDAEAFLDAIESLFGLADSIERFDADDNQSPPIHVFVYRDLPDEGWTTAITYGLSAAEHPDWRYGKPELMLCIDSKLDDWPRALGAFAAMFRSENSFEYGSVLTTDVPVAADTEMSGFVVFEPPLPDAVEEQIDLPNKVVHLRGMYPIHAKEVPLIRELGLEEFWHHPDFEEPLNPARPPIA